MPVIVVTGQRQMQGPVGIGTSPVSGASLTTSQPVLLPAGTAAAPALAFSAATGSGLFRASGGGESLYISSGGIQQFRFMGDSTAPIILNGLRFSPNPQNNGPDVGLTRDAANVLALINGNSAEAFRIYAGYGGYWELGSLSESITLNTGGTTTDSSANLLPADAIIEAVTARVTTTITTATNWALGDGTTGARFLAATTDLTAGTTKVGLAHSDQTGAGGPKQLTAAKLRITTTGTPGAGVIRVQTFFRRFVAPTS